MANSKIDLSKLTKEQKLRILDLLEEKKRKARLKPEHYKPNEGQAIIHRCEAINRFCFSGNAFGKTALMANEADWAAKGYNPVLKEHTYVPCRVIIVLDKPEKVESVWLPELRKWSALRDDQLHKRGKPYYSQITYDNGSTITFMFHDQEPLSFESIEADFFIFDEPPKRAIWVALKRAGRTKGRKARYLLGGTPLAAPWLRTDIYEKWARGELKDTECFRFDSDMNRGNLAEGYLETFSAALSDKERRIRLHGEFFDLDGLALSHVFKRATHTVGPEVLEEFQEHRWPCVIAVDPHPEKNHHAVLMGADAKNQLYVLKELSSKCLPSEFAGKLREMTEGFKVVDWVCDNMGSGQYTGGEGFASFIEVLRKNGIRIRPTTYKEKQDDDFVVRIQEALLVPKEGGPRLRLVSSCKGAISDFENVEWVKYRDLDMHKPKLNIANKDFLACVKYALATNLTFTKSRSKIIKTAGPVSWNKR